MEGGEEGACYVCDPGSELLRRGEGEKQGENNKWDGTIDEHLVNILEYRTKYIHN